MYPLTKINKKTNALHVWIHPKDRPDLRRALAEYGLATAWADLWDRTQASGGIAPMPPELCGLTDDPYCLAEYASPLEDGNGVHVTGRLWHYPNYMLECAMEKLLRGRTVVFDCWHVTPDEGETRKFNY